MTHPADAAEQCTYEVPLPQAVHRGSSPQPLPPAKIAGPPRPTKDSLVAPPESEYIDLNTHARAVPRLTPEPEPEHTYLPILPTSAQELYLPMGAPK